MASSEPKVLKRNPRKFIPDDLEVTSWNKLEGYFIELRDRNIASGGDLEKWILDRSELETFLQEDLAWRYIRMTCDTTDKALTDSYTFFVSEIDPKIAPYTNEFNKKLVDSPYLKEVKLAGFSITLRGVKKALEIYREENIPLFTQLQTESQKYGAISSEMTVFVEDKEITLQQAAVYLKHTDRAKREQVYKKIHERRAKDKQKLNDLFTLLIDLRNQVGKNADFANYRDYMFASLGRFDYTVEDCYNFHQSILEEIVPLVEEAHQKRKKALGLEKLKPWDTEVDVTGKPALKPFSGSEELIRKTIQCFYKIRPFFGECLEIMNNMKHLDLDSRKGKAPGGYNYPLYEIGVPFIFMNSVGSVKDLVTMVHEGGHAIHSFLNRDLEIADFKSIPSEVAELASMSMELISMEHWDVFFDNEEDLKRAKREQLDSVLKALPWIAAIDKFQHWIYENPSHTIEQRTESWMKIMTDFGSSVIDWSGNEEILSRTWQGQLHLFEVPFYYIEYGMAQLGAIALWRNYKQNPERALDGYVAGLKVGYTKTIPEIYKAAGISFDFSPSYVKELALFVKKELENI